MSYDTRCFELAEAFLDPEECTFCSMVREVAVDKLAQGIQDYVEDFLNDPDNFPPPEPKFDTRRERDEWRHEAAEQQRLK